MISVIYHVSVDIPEDVYRGFGQSLAYQHAVSNAIQGFTAAGQNSYCDVEEWAEFDTIEAARCCERNLQRMITQFKEQL